jgi:hypothetical protein
LNPIRCKQGASLLGKGEACGDRRERETTLSMSTARTLVVAGMVGASRQGREHVDDERAVGVGRCSWPSGPKSRPAAVRALVVAMKRVTTVEPRGVGRWNREENNLAI